MYFNNNKYNRNIVLDDDTQVIAFSFSDDEDEIFEEENSKFNRRNSPQKAKLMRKKIPRQHESKSSDGESSSEIQEDSDSSPTALYEIETRKNPISFFFANCSKLEGTSYCLARSV